MLLAGIHHTGCKQSLNCLNKNILTVSGQDISVSAKIGFKNSAFIISNRGNIIKENNFIH